MVANLMSVNADGEEYVYDTAFATLKGLRPKVPVKQMVQVRHPVFDEIMCRLTGYDEMTTERSIPNPDDVANFEAIVKRHRVGEVDTVYWHEQTPSGESRTALMEQAFEDIYSQFERVARQGKHHLPSYLTLWQKYSGATRGHYLKCAAYLHCWGGIVDPIKFDTFAKSGELQPPVYDPEGDIKTRCIIMQQIKARRTEVDFPINTSEGIVYKRVFIADGEPLRVPIYLENIFRHYQEHLAAEFFNVDGSRIFITGMSMIEIGEDMVESMEGPVAGCVRSVDVGQDASNFDGSILIPMGLETRSFYSFVAKMFPDHPFLDDLAKVLASQRRVKIDGRSLKAYLSSKRGSGEAGTAIGNKMIMLAAFNTMLAGIAAPYSAKLDGTGVVISKVGGDDSRFRVPLALDQTWSDLMPVWFEEMNKMGLKMKFENVTISTEDLIFFRSRLYRIPVFKNGEPDHAWALMKDVPSLLFSVLNIRRHLRSTQWGAYLATLHECLRLYDGVPVATALRYIFPEGVYDGSTLARSGLEYQFQFEKTHTHRVRDVKYEYRFGTGPTEESRQRFFSLYNISADEQVEFENWIAHIAPEVRAALLALQMRRV